jgi:signal transduction histidine kinase
LSLVPYEHSERIALVGTILLDVFVLIASGLLARRAVGAALRPVADMTQRVADWTATDMHRRFDVGRPRDELTALAATFDGLLERIETALRHEQRLTAEVAHELRTPLSGVRAEAELALSAGHSDEELRLALERVLAGTDRMAAAIQTLLTTARIATVGTPGYAELTGAVSDVVDALRPAANAHGIAIELPRSGSPFAVGASADVVAQALQPLIDNAVRHAASTVTVTMEADGSDAVVCVLDDGSGLDAAAAEHVFEAGVSTTGSAGLGLPLARRLARSCGGDVVAVPAACGGRFELRLPATAHQRSGNVQIA